VAKLSTAPVGRPRRFDDQAERRMLIEAAIRVMGRSPDASFALEDILAEAGLSTRAFYRHFTSKEGMVDALLLREAETVGRSLSRVAAAAPDPVRALEAWIERFLDIFHDPRRAERAVLLSTAGDRAERISGALVKEMRRISCAPLVEVLRAGHAAGLLTSPRPEADAYSIYALAMATYEARGEDEPPDRAEAWAHLKRFAWPALGLPAA
jgi:AcrR family transcriptional regulator